MVEELIQGLFSINLGFFCVFYPFCFIRWILFQSSQEKAASFGIIPNIVNLFDFNERKQLLKDHRSSSNISGLSVGDIMKGYGFNVSRYSLEQLSQKRHDYELEEDEDEAIHVHLDYRTMGVGGYDSWTPNVDKDYLIQPNGYPMTASFRLIPLKSM
jgi:hypothetical protein